MSDTSFRRHALSGHQLPPLCGPDNLTRGLAEAKPIRQTCPFRHGGAGDEGGSWTPRGPCPKVIL